MKAGKSISSAPPVTTTIRNPIRCCRILTPPPPCSEHRQRTSELLDDERKVPMGGAWNGSMRMQFADDPAPLFRSRRQPQFIAVLGLLDDCRPHGSDPVNLDGPYGA